MYRYPGEVVSGHNQSHKSLLYIQVDGAVNYEPYGEPVSQKRAFSGVRKSFVQPAAVMAFLRPRVVCWLWELPNLPTTRFYRCIGIMVPVSKGWGEKRSTGSIFANYAGVRCSGFVSG